MRLAVELAAAGPRWAWAPGTSGTGRRVPEQEVAASVARCAPSPSRSTPLSASVPGGFAMAGVVDLLAHRFGSPVDPLAALVVLHPAHWPAGAARRAAHQLLGPAPPVPVQLQPAALGAAREVAARWPPLPGPVGVLEVGPRGGSPDYPTLLATVLSTASAGTVLAYRTHPGYRAEHAVRLLAQAAADAGTHPAELTGGVLLLADADCSAELREPLTDLVGEHPVCPADPAAVAVLGALRPPEPAPGPEPRWGTVGDPAPAGGGVALATGLLPPPPRPHRVRTALTGLTVSLGAAALTAASTSAPPAPAGRPTERPLAASPALLAQYDYLLRVPDGWRHTGGLAERRRSVLTPLAAPHGSDLIAIEQTPLGYDSTAEPDRAVRELRVQHERAVAAGAPLTELTEAAPLAGRRLLTYHQRQPEQGTEVDWYVLFEADAQLSVGCQHTPAVAPTVRAACAVVLGSLRLHR